MIRCREDGARLFLRYSVKEETVVTDCTKRNSECNQEKKKKSKLTWSNIDIIIILRATSCGISLLGDIKNLIGEDPGKTNVILELAPVCIGY